MTCTEKLWPAIGRLPPNGGPRVGMPSGPGQPEPNVVDELFEVIEGRKRERPEGSYVSALLQAGVDRIGKKVIEEAGEVVIAAKNASRDEITHEVADLWFHSLILLSSAGLRPEDIWEELRSRRK